MKSYYGTIAEWWKPTFENVTREFITNNLYKILFSEELPNFRFEFREDEAIEFIEDILYNYTKEYNFYKEKSQKILQSIKKKSDGNTLSPVMIVEDYKKFFELLRQFYERDIELYFLRTKMSGFTRYEKDNCFEQIWLRATPDDFNNPEEFLRRQVEMINDKTFEKYDDETYLGPVNFLDNNVLCVENGIARTWDENSREIRFTIYDKKYYKNTELFYRPHYSLPKIRYGIYQKDGKKVCSIGSIQNINNEKNDINKKVNREKYRVNSGVPEEDTYKVEPKNLLVLSLFINILHKHNITEIEVPSLYVLDYEYHQKRQKQHLLEFEKKWTESEMKQNPKQYKIESKYLEDNIGKEDLISELKTERLLLTFRRLLNHYTNAKINSYPGDSDSFMHLNIPVVQSKEELKGNIFKELYQLLGETNIER